MKRIVFFLLLLTSFFARAQSPVQVPNPYNFLKWIAVRDSVTSKFYIQQVDAQRDTLATQRYARGFAGGSVVLHGGYAIKISGDTVILDSAHYRKVDTLYTVTDSTFIIKINGTVTAYKMRGAVFSFNGRIGPIVPQRSDYATFSPLLDSVYFDPSFIATLRFSKINLLPNTLAGYGIGDAVKNLGGGQGLGSGGIASRGPFTTFGNFYYANDVAQLYWSDGTQWYAIGGGAGTGNIVGSLTPGRFTYAQTSGQIGSAPMINDTTNSRIQFNTPILINSTLASILDKGTTAQRPVSPATGMLRFNTDSAGYEQYTGASWVKFSAGASGNSGTVTSIAFGRGFTGTPTITSAGSVTVDTVMIPRFADTLTKIATWSFVNSRGFLTAETDPVANAKIITLNQVTNGGITITGTAGQTVGSGPTWSVKADTAILATKTDISRRITGAGTAGNISYWTGSQVYTASIVNDTANNRFTFGRPIYPSTGSATAGTAPIYFGSGPVLTTPVNGAVEYNGTHFYGTVGGTRYQLENQTPLNGTAGNLSYYTGSGLYTVGIKNDTTNNRFQFSRPVLLPASTTSAGTAPIKVTSGTLMTTPEDGAVEYNGTHWYVTIGSTRYQLDQQSGGGGQAMRISPLDSMAHVANGMQVTGYNIVPQLADVVASGYPGFISAPNNALADSIRRGLKKSVLTLTYKGVGQRPVYSNAAGDTLIAPGYQVSSDLTLVAQTDSSRLFGINFSTVAGVNTTQTLLNKTLTSPVLNSPVLNNSQMTTSSTTGYYWQATDNSGHGQWAPSAFGGIIITPSAFGDTINGTLFPLSTSSLAGAESPLNNRKLSSQWYPKNPKNSGDSMFFAIVDTLFSKGLIAGPGLKHVLTQTSIDTRMDSTWWAAYFKGDITMAPDGTLSIGNGKVTNSDLAGSIDLTTKVAGILPSTNGGTGNAFTAFAGNSGIVKTYTLPNVSSNILTDAAAVSIAQGGLQRTTAITGIVKGTGSGYTNGQSGTDYAPGTSALATGMVKSTTSTGVLSIGVSGTDYAPGTSALSTGLLKSTTSTGALTIAASGTDYAPPTSALGNGLLKNTTGTGVHTIAVSGTDYAPGTSALATGILKSTTSTGALTTAVVADFPTLNQNTTGTSANVTGTVAAANGGTGLASYTIGQMLVASGSTALTVVTPNVLTTTKYLRQSGNGTAVTGTLWSSIPETDIFFSDNTSSNASTGMHGYLKKLSGNSLEYMGGTGNWGVPLNIANGDLTLTGNRTLSGGGFSLALGSSGSPVTNFTVTSNAYTNILGTPAYRTMTNVTDANYAASVGGKRWNLPNITANRTFTLPIITSAGGDTEIELWNQNVTFFKWSPSASIIDAAGQTVTSFANQTLYVLGYDVSLSKWFVKSAFSTVAPPAGSFTGWQVVASGTSGTATASNVQIFASSQLASYNLTLPASPVDGQVCDIYIGNAISSAGVTAFTLTPSSGTTLWGAYSFPANLSYGFVMHCVYQAGNTQWMVK